MSEDARAAITDEMVEAAVKAYFDKYEMGSDHDKSLFRAALEAVAPMIRKAAMEEAMSLHDERGGNIRDELLASQYRAGAQAGWNAAQLDEPHASKEFATLTRVNPGDLKHIREARKSTP